MPKPRSAMSARRFARLAEGGRLVAITGHNVAPDQPAWRDSFVASAGERPRRLHRDDRRPGLCAPRYHASRRGSPSSTAFRPRIRAPFRRRPAWRPMPRELLDWVSPPGPAAAAGYGTLPCRRPRHVSAARGRRRAPESLCRSSRSSNARRRCRMWSSLPTRRATGRRTHPRFTASLYEGYALQTDPYSRARSRIRPSSSSRPPWPPSPLPAPPTGRICRRG